MREAQTELGKDFSVIWLNPWNSYIIYNTSQNFIRGNLEICLPLFYELWHKADFDCTHF